MDKTTINGAEVSIAKVLQGTNGDDSLYIDSDAYRVEALAGNDIVSIGADVIGTSVEGGTGNDLIIGNAKGNFYIYADGDGTDTIQGFTASDTINITSGTFDSSLASGKNLVLNVGKGSIVLENVIGRVEKANIKIGNAATAEYKIELIRPRRIICSTKTADTWSAWAAATIPLRTTAKA